MNRSSCNPCKGILGSWRLARPIRVEAIHVRCKIHSGSKSLSSLRVIRLLHVGTFRSETPSLPSLAEQWAEELTAIIQYHLEGKVERPKVVKLKASRAVPALVRIFAYPGLLTTTCGNVITHWSE